MSKKLLRRKKSLVHVEGQVESNYCRRCMNTKPIKDFFLAVDKFLDINGYLSICKECVSKIYVGFYNSQHDLDRAIFKTCKAINVLYSQPAVEATRTHLRNQEKLEDDEKVFGIYKTKIASTMRGVGAAKMGESVSMDFTFQTETSVIPEYLEGEASFDGAQGVVEFWGGEGHFSTEDYRFLEKELAEWKQSYSCQTKAEEFYIKQACLLTLQLEQARTEGKTGDNILKSMQELLKGGGLTPAQQNIASSGKGTETWGIFIKNIEETTPAEYFKDKELFKDVDGIGEYIKKYITRPLKNFVTGSRDFNMTEEDMTEYDEPELEVENATKEGKTE